MHIVEDLSLNPDLEEAAAEVYRVANSRALERARLRQDDEEPQNEELELALMERLKLTEAEGKRTDEDPRGGLLEGLDRSRQEDEALLDLIRGGKAAQAAEVAMNAAEYLRQLVDARTWGPSVLFVTE